MTETATARADAANNATLSVDDAVRLQNALIKGYMKEDFQKLIWETYSVVLGGADDDPECEREWVRRKAAACQEVQFPILPRFGFEASLSGVLASKRAFTPAVRARPRVAENHRLMKYLLDPRIQWAVERGKEPAPRGVLRSRLMSPDPASRTMESSGNVWRVASGHNGTCGINVRKSASRGSPTLAARLTVNSLVEEVERKGHHIKYLLMEGSGPDIGWASICSLEGDRHLVPFFPDADQELMHEDLPTTSSTAVALESKGNEVTLAVGDAIQLQHALIQGYMSREFQEHLWRKYESIHGDGKEDAPREWAWVRAQRAAAQRVQFPVLERFGFRPSPLGVGASKRAFTPEINADPRVAENKKLMLYLLEPGCQLAVQAGRIQAPRGALPSRLHSPRPGTWMESTGRLWIVASDIEPDYQGIVARKTANLHSPAYRAWLEPGSLIEEVETQDGWIRYLLARGSGPNSGWVRTTVAGKSLLVPAFDSGEEVVHEEHLNAICDTVTEKTGPEVPVTETAIVLQEDADKVTLSVDDAIKLQHALIRGYMTKDFQQLVWGAYTSFEGATVDLDLEMQWVEKQRTLAESVQFAAIERFGFEPSPDGVRASRRAFTPLINADPRVVQNRKLMTYLLDPRYQMSVQAGKLPAPRGALWSRVRSPDPDTWVAQTNGKVWTVVGGKDAGGILARRTADMTTAPFLYRLGFGSWVEELDRCGHRIKFRLMEGSGPEVGWASISTAGQPLLAPAFSDADDDGMDEEYFKVVHDRIAQRTDPDLKSQAIGLKPKGSIVRGVVIQCNGVEWLQVRASTTGLCFMLLDGSAIGLGTLLERLPADESDIRTKRRMRQKTQLTAEEVLAIHRRLINGYLAEDFQSALWEVHRRTIGRKSEWVPARARLTAVVQYPIIREFGFAETPEGVAACVHAVPAELRDDPRILENRSLMKYLVEPDIQLDVAKGKRKAPRGVPVTRRTYPYPEDRLTPTGRIWVVVGGEDTGGIKVRLGKGKDSAVLSKRLVPGSMVEEAERDRARMKYLLVEGAGPAIGWVSLHSGKKLLLAPAWSDLSDDRGGDQSTWVVVHQRIMQRDKPETNAKIVGMLKRGSTVRGSVVEQGNWLEVVAEHGLCYMLIDGTSLGLGMLLERAPGVERKLALPK